jgi:hypothetical protein
MPKKAPPAALSISSPIPRTPDAAYFPSAASPSYRSPSGAYRSPSNPQGGRNVSARPWGRGRDGRADGHGHGDGAADGLGQGQGQGQGGDGLGMGIRGYDDVSGDYSGTQKTGTRRVTGSGTCFNQQTTLSSVFGRGRRFCLPSGFGTARSLLWRWRCM